MMTPSLSHVELDMTSFLSRFFLIPIFCQTILLHSRFAIRFKWLRLALAIPAIYFSARITWIYRLEPLAESIAVNFRWGIFSPFFILRSIEYAFANAEEYEWVGFKHKRDESEGIRVKQQTGTGNITNGNERRIENGTALPSRNGSWSNYIDSDVGGSDIEHIRREKREDDWITVLGKSTALFTSLRGHGYAFGPTFDPASSHRRVSNTEFIRRNVINLFINHCISTFCIIILITPHLSLVHLFSFVLSSKLAAFVSSSLAYLSVGCSLLAQMNLGHDFFALSYLIAITFLRLRAIIPASSRFRPLPFDSREWPPLFNSPFLMTSVTSFWGVRWHSFFRKPFLKVGYWPVAYMFRKLGLSAIGKILGVYAVFALSAAMHHLGTPHFFPFAQLYNLLTSI